MIAQRVSQLLENADAAHDMYHIQRVVKLSHQIGKSIQANLELVEHLAYLHEVGDRKVLPNTTIAEVLQPLGYTDIQIQKYTRMVSALAWSSDVDLSTFPEEEYQAIIAVKDADMLEALGAIGIARCMAYTGKQDRCIINNELPRENLTKAMYKSKDSSSAVNHFYEKLLHLDKDMRTPLGLELAKQRIEYMQNYLKQLATETTL